MRITTTMKRLLAAAAVIASAAIGAAVAQNAGQTLSTLTGNELVQVNTTSPTFQYATLNTIKSFVGGSSGSTTLGFYGVTPVTRPTNAAQAAITDGSGGTAAPTTGVSSTLGAAVLTIPVTMSALANSQVYQVMPGFAGKLIGINFRTTVAITTGGKAATLQAQAAGVSVTGGVVTLSGAYTLGNGVNGTAITAGTQTFANGSTVGFTVSGVTTFSEGSGIVTLVVQDTATADAVATIVAFTTAIRTALVSLGLILGS